MRGGGCASAVEQRELIAELFWPTVTAAGVVWWIGAVCAIPPAGHDGRERPAALLEDVELDSLGCPDGWKADCTPSLNGLPYWPINHN